MNRLSPIYHFWHFLCDFAISVCIFCIFWVHFFAFFYVFNDEDFLCAFSFDFLWIFLYFCVHFLNFLLPPIVEVQDQYGENYKLVINNAPQKTYRIAQYTISWYRLHSLWYAVGVPTPPTSMEDSLSCCVTGAGPSCARATLALLVAGSYSISPTPIRNPRNPNPALRRATQRKFQPWSACRKKIRPRGAILTSKNCWNA
jgi:hypothetical protein